jgi:thiol-disulfide isomerase/thioredoxin
MKLTHKDKSLILLIASTLVVIWVVFALVSKFFFSTTFAVSDASKIIDNSKNSKWFNLGKPLEISDLKDRVILLDFWSYSCVSCIEAISEIKELKQTFGSKLTVIGVHVGKFENDKTSNAIQKAVLKYDIDYPVINDSESKLADSFEVKAIPSFVLINPHGNTYEIYEGDSKLDELRSGVKKLISKYKFEITRDSLPLVLDKYSVLGNVLMFPSHIEYAYDFSYKTRQLPALFISNTGKDNIVVSSITGDIVVKIGSGQKGFQDGSFDVATFNSPRGLIFNSNKLYVADSGNNAIREIDFKEGKVTTILGSGANGFVIEDGKSHNGEDVELSFPMDIEFFPTKNEIAIANSGSNQILSYNIKSNEVMVVAGNGADGIKDGKYPQNSLSQTSALSAFNNKLYFTDSNSSALRVMEENGEIKTLIGQDSKKFGHKNGDKSTALMQHPQGLLVDDTGAYISDSFNHRIRKYDFSTNQIRDIVGNSKSGMGLGSSSNTQFDEPMGITSILDRLFIVDSNNNRIVILNRGTFSSELLDVMPPLKFSKEGFLEYLPNLQQSENLVVKSDSEIVLKIKVKKGWKINEAGPSFINLLEMIKERKADLVMNFDWNNIATKEMKLPKLIEGKDYLLQGVIYYCEDKINSLCYIKSYEQRIAADSGEKNSEVIIDLDMSNSK